MTGRRVAVALGSGGARGYAHIGALQVLHERGFEVVGVAGSSMGALVGGLWSAGKLDDYTDWALGLTQLDVVRLLDVSLSAPGAIKAEKIVARVRELLDGARIEDLPIPYTAVATDLGSRRPVWFQRGPADVAIRASIAIPGVITPVVLNGRLLADGGILDPLPVAPIAAAGADLTIGITLAGTDPAEAAQAPEQVSAEPSPVEEWVDRFRRSAAGLLDRDVVRSLSRRFGGGEHAIGPESAAGAIGGSPLVEQAMVEVEGIGLLPVDDVRPEEVAAVAEAAEVDLDRASATGEAFPAGLSRFEVMNRSLDVMHTALTRYRLAGYPPDVLVEIPKKACRTLDFHRAEEMIALGRRLTEEALEAAGLIDGPLEVPGGADGAPGESAGS